MKLNFQFFQMQVDSKLVLFPSDVNMVFSLFDDSALPA